MPGSRAAAEADAHPIPSMIACTRLQLSSNRSRYVVEALTSKNDELFEEHSFAMIADTRTQGSLDAQYDTYKEGNDMMVCLNWLSSSLNSLFNRLCWAQLLRV